MTPNSASPVLKKLITI
jgi:hypothetical protein